MLCNTKILHRIVYRWSWCDGEEAKLRSFFHRHVRISLKNRKLLLEWAQLEFPRKKGVFSGVYLKDWADSHIWNPKTSICIRRGCLRVVCRCFGALGLCAAASGLKPLRLPRAHGH